MSGLTVAVIGGGRWARALAGFLLHNQRRSQDRITRVLHYRPPRELVRAQEDNRSYADAAQTDIPAAAGEVPDVSAVDSAQQAERRQVTSIGVSELGQADVIFLAVPAPSVRKVLRLAAPHLHGAQTLIHAIGSVIPACEEHPHTTLISHAVGEETPIRKVGGLAGPALAPELRKNVGRRAAIGGALEKGEALAFLSEPNITYGIDRVVAVMGDGRGFAWNQINACGKEVFEGRPAPEGCPPVPEGLK